ncbi:interleukin-24 [Cebus imitator]|uniref:interleukin-24 n=1 Tax=Cebus imitator TaxID=2715852 RepID=UPI00080A2014|nr:interleukin-24 [Cebus imitator]
MARPAALSWRGRKTPASRQCTLGHRFAIVSIFPFRSPRDWPGQTLRAFFQGISLWVRGPASGAASLSFSRPSCPPLLAMASRMQMAALTCLSLLLLWSQVPGAQGQKFQFGPCQVKGVLPQKLWEAFWAVKDTMQAQDNITSVRLLRQEVLQNVSAAESCYLVHTLLEFYLKTVFKNYHDRTVEVRTLKSFSTLANNFVLIVSQLQPSQENEMFAIRDSAHRRFLLFRRAFKQLDMEAALTKALGEVDVLLTWMQKFYKF